MHFKININKYLEYNNKCTICIKMIQNVHGQDITQMCTNTCEKYVILFIPRPEQI